ncbi:hypothetical protein DFR24_1757 [Panacagrimonas perspica]|uniref:DUF5666 domain-containing protein n=1 Tax=Panacagrimonas perspica TaxID=381431 RepID=A0A4S3KAT8_9GAMM|nr:hypothetical protein [Panacagrimonas perspica]TDU32363.1 hypothetical protein DFR24_1757 [Panacagrimonas perspica]THD05298.1 hypothetical protein B1810_00675 [Panacagrimonas perspica]
MKNYFLASVVAASLSLLSLSAVAKDEAMASILKDRNGKKVTVVLQSGTELSGKIKDVGSNTLTLTELSGKEFFDAVVDLDDISAVQYRAREN